MAPPSPREVKVRYFLVGSVVVTAIAFLYTIAVQPEVPNWQREEDPHKFGFPRWYNGRNAECPYDAPPVDSGSNEALDVLLFIDLAHNSPSLPNAFYTLDILEAQPNVAVRVIAPFSPPWKKPLSVAKNLEQAGCAQVLWRIGDGPVDLGNVCPDSIVIDEVGSHSIIKPKINRRANVTLLSDSLQVPKEQDGHWRSGLVAQVPPAASPFHFVPTRLVSSHRALTYFPRPTTSYGAWPAMPKGCTLYKQRSPPEPPETVMRKMNRWDIFEPVSAFRSFWRGYDETLAFNMAHAGVCVFEDWRNGVIDTRVAQAMLSGCLVAAAIPRDETSKYISELILPLDTNGDNVPAAQVSEALQNVSEYDLKKKLLRAFVFARHSLTGDTRLSAVVNVLNRWKQGERGQIIEHGHRPLCEANDSRPAWCQ